MQALADIDAPLVVTSVASAGTCDIGATNTRGVLITGTTAVTSFGSRRFKERLVRFGGALTLTHNATSLILPGAADIATAANDTCLAVSDGSGNWRVLDYARASGKAVAGPAAADITDASTSGRSVLTGTAAQGATALGLGTGNSPTLAGLTLTGSLASTALNAVSVDGSAGEVRAWIGKRSASGSAFQYVTATSIGVYDSIWGNVWSYNGATFAVAGNLSSAGPMSPGAYTVAALPAGIAGQMIYVSNARKLGEASGAGTGVMAYYSNNAWRRLSDDTAVAA